MSLARLSQSQPLTIYQTALLALQAGISCVPILADGTKQPALKWKCYQQRRPTHAEVSRWFRQTGQNQGLALITGKVSGGQDVGLGQDIGLEMLDFDTLEVYERFVSRAREEGLALLLHRLERGYQERSPRGVHLYYRCSWIEGNKKLAQRPQDEPPYVQSLIETRGEGGYSIAAPSSGGVHPSGEPYQVLQGHLRNIAVISAEARALLHAVARSLDEIPPPTRKKQAQTHQRRSQQSRGARPGDIFNAQATWKDILESHDWVWVKQIGDEDFWRRPGKNKGISATTNFGGTDRLYVFSTSTTIASQRSVDKFGAYTWLNHHGDFRESAKALAQQRYVDESA